jgi:hypothetical protein
MGIGNMMSVLKNASRLPLAPTMAGLFGLVAAILVMATPRALLWTVVSKTGINNVIPSAAPPLGMTAKLLLGSVAFIVVAALAFIIAKVIEKRMGGTARRRGFGADAKTTQQDAAVAPAAKSSAAETSRRRPIIAGQELGAPFMSDEALAEAPINTEFDAQSEFAQPEYTMPSSMQDGFMTEGFVQNDYAPVEALPVAPVPVPVQEEEPLTLGLNSLADSVPFARSVDSFADHHAVKVPVAHAPEPTTPAPTFNPYANREDAYAPVETDNRGFAGTYNTPQPSPEPQYAAPVAVGPFAVEPVPAQVSDYAVPEFAVPTYDHHAPEVEPAAVAPVAHNDHHEEKVSISELVARFEQGMAQLARLTQEERDHAAKQAQPHREGTPIALHEALGRLEKLAGGQRL